VSAGTSLSAFWIMVNNTWMQAPTGFAMRPDGVFVPTDWSAIVLNAVVAVRFPHMVLAAFVTSAFCIAATGAWYLLRGVAVEEGKVMLTMALRLAAILVPAQLFFGHLVGDYVHDRQPAKFAAIEGRWQDEQPASGPSDQQVSRCRAVSGQRYRFDEPGVEGSGDQDHQT
jgi:cytochrome d ubiquinol oxidase subunit I